jgi:hypothetical protein
MDEELADRQHAVERDKDQDDAAEKGGRSPRDAWEFRTRGARGARMMPAFEILSSSRILSSAKTFPYC